MGDREHAPSIIFMDEIDSIGSTRTESGGGGGDSEVQRTMLELLNQLDGFEATQNIKVLAPLQSFGIMEIRRPKVVFPSAGDHGHQQDRYSRFGPAAPRPH